MELVPGSSCSDPVSRDNSIQDVTNGTEDDDASTRHGTRPPLPSHNVDEGANTAGTGESGPRDDPVCETIAVRPPPAPSISVVRPPVRPPLVPRKSCLKTSPISSPHFYSPSPSTPSSPSFSCSTPTFTTFSDTSPRGSGSSTPKKCVSWCSQDHKGTGYLEEEFTADSWDRTATEPTRTPLSYKDILELKAIQRSLPCAQQLPDPFTGKPVNQYLSTVPIALLPLLPDSAPHTPLSTPNLSPNSSTVGTPHGSGNSSPTIPSPEFSQRSTPRSSPEQSTLSSARNSPHVSPLPSPNRSPNRSPERNASVHAHTPKISSPLVPSYPPTPGPPTFPPRNTPSNTLSPATPRARPKPTFTFLPLLETPVTSPPASAPVSPPSSTVDLNTQALDAALGSLYNKDKDKDSFSQNEEDSPPPTPALTVTSLNGDSCSEVDTELSDIGEDIPFGVSFKKDARGHGSWRNRDRSRTIKPKKKKNVIYINGEEVDLDGDDDGGEPSVENSRSPTPSPVDKSSSCSNVIYINGEPCTLDDPVDIPPKREPPGPSSLSSPSPSPRPRAPSPERQGRHSSPISPFHRAHPNLPRARTPSPDSDADRKPRSFAPISPFHRAHPNIKLGSASTSPCRE
ncbi:hypothetical protein PM082_003924 [Marasmius tenuissimus]|nr:hypothetical protein PM082_003924 [Marasmius tenuissimus]